MKKVMITGASGLLGRALYDEFFKSSWKVLGLAYSRVKGDLVKINLHDFLAVKNLVHDFKPDVIVHAAAERSPDKVEKDYETSYSLNVNCSRNLAELAKEIKAAFLYISTDYVFDGLNPPYKELDVPNPINQYGLSKWEGEKAIMEVNPDSCILRVPVLYGEEEYIGESAVSSLLKALFNKNESVTVSNYEIRYPSCTSDISRICLQLLEIKLKDSSLNGVFHWCGEESLTKFKMIMVLAEEFSLSPSHIVPISEQPSNVTCLRPINTQLSCERLKNLGIGQHTNFRDGVKSFRNLLNTHSSV